MDEKIEKIIADLESIKSEVVNYNDDYWSERESAVFNINRALSDLRWIEIFREEREATSRWLLRNYSETS